jgi:hypothetical protein
LWENIVRSFRGFPHHTYVTLKIVIHNEIVKHTLLICGIKNYKTLEFGVTFFVNLFVHR